MERFSILEWAWLSLLGLAGAGLYALHIRATRPIEIITITLTGITVAAFFGPALHDAILPAFAKGESSLTAVGFGSGYLGMLIVRFMQKAFTLIAPQAMARMGLDVQPRERRDDLD
ncbi:hypothetical protein [Hyphobacterium sp.]|uniref:hypothetical protein n=1 Tax=Hyphobacterium sp. TaxID=2004662 RepID=UPI003B52B4DF